MSSVSGISSGTAAARPAATPPIKPKPAPTAPTSAQGKGSDPDHDGDTHAGRLDVTG